MPRFKTADYGLKLIPVDFAQQVLPGTFVFALCHLVDNDLDLSALRARYPNDAAVPEWQTASVWFCGPPRFGQALRDDFVAHGLPPDRFHQELFEMR